MVPEKLPNNDARALGGGDGGTGPGQREPAGAKHSRTQGRERVLSALKRVRQAAEADKTMRFSALLHHVYHIDALRMAYFHLKHEAAPGVDGETWRHYGQALEEHLQDLSERLKRGTYRAKPVRRAYIVRTDGRMRPLGVTALEDKLVQRAVVEVMNAIYETDFVNFSYGFRPRRSQHDALDALYAGLLTRKVNGVLDAGYPWLFRRHRAWMAGEIHRAPHRGSTPSCDSSRNG